MRGCILCPHCDSCVCAVTRQTLAAFTSLFSGEAGTEEEEEDKARHKRHICCLSDAPTAAKQAAAAHDGVAAGFKRQSRR